MNKLNVIDLFAGCGGLSLGFRRSGFNISAHLEINPNCCATLRKNVSSNEIILNVDITQHEEYLE